MRFRPGLPLLFGISLWCAAASAQDVEPSPQRMAASDIHHAPHTVDGYQNNDGPLARGSIWRWRWNAFVNHLPPPPENNYAFPIDRPDVPCLKANRSVDTLTWIGHASSLLQVGGANVLIDPVFSERASPFSFIGPKRRTPPGLTLGQLPHIEVVVISHSHYDHLDVDSVQALNKQASGPPLFLVPLGLKAWFAGKGIDNVQELDWGDHTRAAGLDFWFVPSTHWSARSLGDRNDTLWGGWAIKTAPGAAKPLSVYFAGDTGYSGDSKRIGKAFGCFDLALIPIGAYAPRWFMGPQHIDPFEAVKVFQDVGAKKAVGIHWGTFELTDEPLDEPPKLLREAVAKAGLAQEAFGVLHHGQTIRLEGSCSP